MRTDLLDDDLAHGLVEAGPDALVVISEAERIVFVNAQGEALTGYPRQELIGQPVTVLFPEAAAHLALREAFSAAPPTFPRPASRVFSCRQKSGSELPVEVSWGPVPTRQGRVVAATLRDVSERQRVEQALRRSEESLVRAQRVAHVGSSDWDLRTNQVIRSAELLALYGVEGNPDYKETWSLMALVHPEDHEHVYAAVRTAIAEGRDYQVEYRIVRPDGTERFVLSHGELLLEDGRPTRILATVLDLTERKRAERAQEELLRWLHAVLEQCPIGIVLLSGPGGKPMQANTHAQAIFGEPLSRIEQYAGRWFKPDEQPIALEDLPGLRALRGERTEGQELTLRNARGETIPILTDAAPIFDASGAVQGSVVVFQDITPIKQIERLRAEWNSIIAHDLRQPLHTIALCTQLLARRKTDLVGRRAAVSLQAPLETINTAVTRLNRMIGDLLDLSRLEVRQLTLARHPADVLALIAAAVERFTLEAPDRRFAVHSRGPIPPVWVDEDRIAQVLDNILSNALKYSEKQTPIRVEVEANPQAVTVAITNLGKGISPTELPWLFQRFRRTGPAQRGLVQGVGLGLYIVRELIEAHGGSIAASSAPGGDTTFRFTLPTVTAPAP